MEPYPCKDIVCYICGILAPNDAMALGFACKTLYKIVVGSPRIKRVRGVVRANKTIGIPYLKEKFKNIRPGCSLMKQFYSIFGVTAYINIIRNGYHTFSIIPAEILGKSAKDKLIFTGNINGLIINSAIRGMGVVKSGFYCLSALLFYEHMAIPYPTHGNMTYIISTDIHDLIITEIYDIFPL